MLSIEGTIEGESWWSNSLSLSISFARSGAVGRGAPNAIRKRSPISAQMARECSSLMRMLARRVEFIAIAAYLEDTSVVSSGSSANCEDAREDPA